MQLGNNWQIVGKQRTLDPLCMPFRKYGLSGVRIFNKNLPHKPQMVVDPAQVIGYTHQFTRFTRYIHNKNGPYILRLANTYDFSC